MTIDDHEVNKCHGIILGLEHFEFFEKMWTAPFVVDKCGKLKLSLYIHSVPLLSIILCCLTHFFSFVTFCAKYHYEYHFSIVNTSLVLLDVRLKDEKWYCTSLMLTHTVLDGSIEFLTKRIATDATVILCYGHISALQSGISK